MKGADVSREQIRSEQLKGYSLAELFYVYDQVVEGLETARYLSDHAEKARLLVDRELVGGAIDERVEELEYRFKRDYEFPDELQ